MKTGAKSERDTLRHEMLIAGCSHDLIAQEMERRWAFRPREAYRHAHGWSQDEVAARFTEVADRLGSERAAQSPMIGTRIGEYERWPHGGRRPSAYVITVLGAVFGTTVDRLLDYEDYRHFPDQDRTVFAAMLNGAAAGCGMPAAGQPVVGGRPAAGPGFLPGGLVPLGAVQPEFLGSALVGSPMLDPEANRAWVGGADGSMPGPATLAHAVRGPAGWPQQAGSLATQAMQAVLETAVLETAATETAQQPAVPPGALKTAAQIAAGQIPAAHTPAAHTPAAHTPAAHTPAAHTAAADTAGFETAAHEPAALQTPALQTPALQTPALQTPALQTPALQTPALVQTPAPGTSAPISAPISALERALQTSALATAAPAASTLEMVARQTAALEAAVLHTLATAATPAAAAPTAVPATTARLVQSVLSARAAASLATADHDALVSAPGSTLLRQRRRDELLDQYTGSPPEQEEMIMAAAAGQSAEFGEWAEATNVGPIALEQFDHDIRSIARTYLSSPPLPVVLTTLRVRNRAFALLEGRQYPNQARQLYLIAGRICGLLAWMSSDLGRHMEAETQARTGWLCAELAEHDGLRAWVRATQSKLAYWDGRIKESAQLAEHGLQYSCPDTAPVLLASLAARAWARLGRADDAHSALANATEKREHAGPDEVGGLYGFSAAQQCYLAGTTHLYLAEPDHALREAEQAVALYEAGEPVERFYGAETLALIDAATAHLQGGELAGAAEKLGPVLALPSQQRLATFTQRLSDMRDALRRSRHADSTESIQLQRQIEDFQGEALGQLVGARP